MEKADANGRQGVCFANRFEKRNYSNTLILQELQARHDPALNGQTGAEQRRPEVLDQAQQGNGRQKEKYGPEPVDDGLKNPHEQVWFGSHGSPLRCLGVVFHRGALS